MTKGFKSTLSLDVNFQLFWIKRKITQISAIIRRVTVVLDTYLLSQDCRIFINKSNTIYEDGKDSETKLQAPRCTTLSMRRDEVGSSIISKENSEVYSEFPDIQLQRDSIMLSQRDINPLDTKSQEELEYIENMKKLK